MVTETVEAVDQVPAPEPQTEEQPALPLEEQPALAAAEGEEAAADESTPVLLPDEPQTSLQERIDAQQARLDELNTRLEEQERRRRQNERAKESEEKASKRNQKELAVLKDAVGAALARRGYTEVPDEEIATVIERGFDARATQYDARLHDDLDVALDSLLLGRMDPDELDERQQAVALRAQKKINEWFPQARKLIEEEARKDYIPKSELPKYLKAEQERLNALKREGTDELRRADGSPPETKDRSLEAVTNRIIANEADDSDREYWNNRFGRK